MCHWLVVTNCWSIYNTGNCRLLHCRQNIVTYPQTAVIAIFHVHGICHMWRHSVTFSGSALWLVTTLQQVCLFACVQQTVKLTAMLDTIHKQYKVPQLKHITHLPCTGQHSAPLICSQLAHTLGLHNWPCFSCWASALTVGWHTNLSVNSQPNGMDRKIKEILN